MGQKKVLMVCMGNICRSPMAEAIFQDMIDKAGLNEKWAVESAAIGCWDVGNPINYRAVNT
uniref:Phosphotyrosine protein phosphatase I domain-containing protein n=1 Tax=Megaselia scalaris TaxID=36166 RepID=T1H0I2_MEGSC